MQYIHKDEKNDLEAIPFAYDLRGACIEGKYSQLIFSPLRIEPRLSQIKVSHNNFRESGQFELAKNLIFNNHIQSVEYSYGLVRTKYLYYFNLPFELFTNDSVEELNVSNNYLREDSADLLPKMIKNFKAIKIINLSSNEFKGGLAHFFIVLKNLYRKGQTKLETLMINKCLLDNSSFYELGELLKCKFCGLKKLYLNNNIITFNSTFLKKLKKNRSLVELQLNKTDLGSKNADDINRIISSTEICSLYLYKNKFYDINTFIRILYRTKLIKNFNYDKVMQDKSIERSQEKSLKMPFDSKNQKKRIIKDDAYLLNLDLSNNECQIKSIGHLDFIQKIVKKTNLKCLDISHILMGPHPDKKKSTQENNDYRVKIGNIKEYLEAQKNKQLQIIKEIRINEVDIKRRKELEQDEDCQRFMPKEILEKIIKDKKAIYTIYLKKKVNEIIGLNMKQLNENTENNNQMLKLESKKKLAQKLVDYLILKRAQYYLQDLEYEKNERKLIII